MPEPGELITVTRVAGVDSIISTLGGLSAAVDNLRRDVLAKMTDLEGQFNEQADRTQAALSNIAADVQGLKDDLASLNTDIQGQVDAAVAQRFQAVVDRATALADQAQSIADSTPDRPAPEPTPEPETP